MNPASSIRCAKCSPRGKTPAERLLERYHGEWGGDITRIYEEESF